MTKKMDNAQSDRKLFTAVLPNGREFPIYREDLKSLDLAPSGKTGHHILANNKAYRFELIRADFRLKEFTFSCEGEEIQVKLRDRVDDLVHSLGFEVNGDAQVNEINAPMPGLVLAVNVEEGEEVKKGQKLLILEAMKMENVLTAPSDCRIAKVLVEEGQTVDKAQKLLQLE